MSIKTIHEQGAINLVQGIVDRAVNDFMATTPDSDSRKEIEDFFLSDYFEVLTGLDGSEFLNQLQERYEQKKRKVGKGKQHDDQ